MCAPAALPIIRSATSLARCFQKSGLRPAEFIRSIDYRSVNGGLRARDEWLQTGLGDPLLLRKLVMAYGWEDEIRNALAERAAVKNLEAQHATKERERRERARFRPHIYIETTLSRPTSITIAGVFGCRMKFIHLADDVLQLSQRERLMAVRQIVLEHYRANDGQCPLFGSITGYRFADTYDSSVFLDVHGCILAREARHYIIPLAVGVKIGGKFLKTIAAGMEILSRHDVRFHG